MKRHIVTMLLGALLPISFAAVASAQAVIACGDLVSASINLPGEEDLYSFIGETGDIVVFTLVETTDWGDFGRNDARGTLLSPTGEELDQFDSNVEREVTLPASGEFQLRVSANDMVATGFYNLGFQCLVPPEPPPVALGCGDFVAGSIDAPGEADYFSFEGHAADIIAFTLVETTDWGDFGRNDAQGTLFSATGEQLDEFDSNVERQVMLPASGEYLLRITANNLVATGSYSLGFQCLVPPEPPPAELSCGDLVSESIGVPGEADDFSFVAEAGEVVSFTLVETTDWGDFGRNDAQGTLFSATGEQLDEFDSNVERQVMLPASGEYLLRITANNLVATGEYNLGFQCLVPPEPPPEELSCGDLVSASIDAPGEADYFRFTAGVGEVIALTLVETTDWGDFGRNDAQGTLFSPTGEQLDEFDSNVERQVMLPASGEYLLRITANNLVATGEYNLGFQCLVPPEPPPEELSCGDLVSASIDAPGEADYFRFTAGVGEVIALTLVETTDWGDFGRNDAQGTLFSSTGEQLDEFDSNVERQVTLPASGEYVLRITANNLVARGAYNLGFQCLVPPQPPASTLLCGDLVSASIDAPGEADFFRLAAQAGQVIAFALVETTDWGDFGRNDAQGTLFSPTGEQLDEFDSNVMQQVTLSESTEYLLRITANNLVAAGSYNLGLQCLVPPQPEPTVIRRGDSVSASIEMPAEADFFVFSGEAGQLVAFSLIETSNWGDFGRNDARGTLFSPAGEQLDQFDSDVDTQISLPETGDYLLRITANTLVATGSYELSLPGCGLTCTATVPTIGDVGTSLEFSATATPINCIGPITYNWVLGDGSTSADQNTTHAYGEEGGFEWTLTTSVEDTTCVQSGGVTIWPEGTRLAASLNAPATVRPNRNYTVWLEYGNAGEEDLFAPLFVVSSRQDLPMRLSSVEPFRRGPVQVLGVNMDTPVGILPPGSSFSIPIQFRSSTSANEIQFDLEVLAPGEAAIDWEAVESGVRPSGVPDDVWNAIWSNLRSRIGDTWADYLSTVTAAATFLAEHYREAPGSLDPDGVPPQDRQPVEVYSVRDLFDFELSKAAVGLSPRSILAVGLDVFYPAPGLPLTFLRLAPASLEQRLRLGALGRGWTHIYDYYIRIGENGSVSVQEPWGHLRVFLPAGDGTFSAMTAAEQASLELTAEGYVLREKSGLRFGFETQRVSYLEDIDGNRLDFGYTADVLTSITHSNGDMLTITYNVDERIESIVDPSGRTVRYRYDESGAHLGSVEEVGGPTTTYSYTPADGSPAAHALAEVAFADGTHRYYEYDTSGRLCREWLDRESEILTYAYDEQGTVTTRTELGDTLTMHLGLRGQLLDLETSEENNLALAYDASGNLTRVAHASGVEIMLVYDGNGNPLGIRDPAGGITRFTYDGPVASLASLQDARGSSIELTYDAVGNLASVQYPDGSAEEFEVDSAGNLVSYTNRRLQTITYERNHLGEVTRKNYGDGTSIQYDYDNGNLSSVTDSEGTISFTYDERDSLSRIDYPDGRFLAFQHDDSGRRVARSDETGFTLFYEYDDVGRLERLRDTSGSMIVGYQYDEVGRLAREERGNGTYAVYDYDFEGQLLHLIHYGASGDVQSRFDYTYDQRGNRTSVTTLDGVTTYEYDSLGQLVGIDYPDGLRVTYQYDEVGNRIAVTEAGATIHYTVNQLNQYTEAGEVMFQYDADGNLTSRAEPIGTATFEYDQENRLRRIVGPDEEMWEYAYDALGNRSEFIKNDTVRRYTYDPTGLTDLVAEYDESGNLLSRHVYGLGLVARIDEAGGAAYYSFDALGNTRQITGEIGAVLNTYDWDPWGIPRMTVEEVPNNFLAGGRFGVTTDDSGISHMRSRHYDSRFGRFLSADLAAITGGTMNQYAFVGNSSTNAVDPSGLQPKSSSSIYRDITLGNEVYELSNILVSSRVNDNWYWRMYRGMYPFEHKRMIAKYERLSKLGNRIGFVLSLPGIVNDWAQYRRTASAFIRGEASQLDLIHDAAVAVWSSTLGWALGPGGSLGTLVDWATTPQIGQASVQVIRPIDPNEKTGPDPIVRPGERVTYTIYFENLETATAPAQEVFITDNLDPDLDWSTFELGEVTFGDAVVTSLGGRRDGFDRITYGDYWIDIQATRSPSGDQINWTLRSLDPNTGELPDDPFAGFLPPEDGTGRGQGHVTFSIEIPSDATDGTEISNSASIVFDTNPAISTNTWTSTVQSPSDCAPSELCLNDERFRVEVTWRDFQGNTGTGTPNRLSDESGYFTFFGPTNAEVFIKVLDACSLTGNFWVFDAHLSNVEYTITVTDTQTGQTRTIFNPLGYTAPSVLGTTTLFTECAGGDGAELPTSELVSTDELPPNGTPLVEEIEVPSVVGPCLPDANTMCLNDGRFRVHATFEDFQGSAGIAKQWPLTSDSGYSTFFSDTNVELFIKVLDACGLTGNYWVFASGLTNVDIDLYVEDTESGKVWHTRNPLGRVFATALDTQTFFTDCD